MMHLITGLTSVGKTLSSYPTAAGNGLGLPFRYSDNLWTEYSHFWFRNVNLTKPLCGPTGVANELSPLRDMRRSVGFGSTAAEL